MTKKLIMACCRLGLDKYTGISSFISKDDLEKILGRKITGNGSSALRRDLSKLNYEYDIHYEIIKSGNIITVSNLDVSNNTRGPRKRVIGFTFKGLLGPDSEKRMLEDQIINTQRRMSNEDKKINERLTRINVLSLVVGD